MFMWHICMLHKCISFPEFIELLSAEAQAQSPGSNLNLFNIGPSKVWPMGVLPPDFLSMQAK
jgi:hypothetical protein